MGGFSHGGIFWIDPNGENHVVNNLENPTTLQWHHQDYLEKGRNAAGEPIRSLRSGKRLKATTQAKQEGWIKIHAANYLLVEHNLKEVLGKAAATLMEYFKANYPNGYLINRECNGCGGERQFKGNQGREAEMYALTGEDMTGEEPGQVHLPTTMVDPKTGKAVALRSQEPPLGFTGGSSYYTSKYGEAIYMGFRNWLNQLN